MLVVHLLSWWYIRGWAWLFAGVGSRLSMISDSFSVGTLIRTLFSPWKQIQSQATFRNFLQSKIDNTISRFVGFWVRLFMLMGALFSVLVVLVGGLMAILAWPFVPLLVIGLPILFMIGGL